LEREAGTGSGGVNERRVCQKRRLVALGVWRLSGWDVCCGGNEQESLFGGLRVCAIFAVGMRDARRGSRVGMHRHTSSD
jgi:hypothetical protein